MMIDLYSLILTYAPAKRKNTSKGWLSFDCPCCLDRGELRPDTKMRGGVHPEPDGGVVYNCFNCGFKTRYIPGEPLPKNMKYLFRKLGMPDDDITRLSYDIWRETIENKTESKIAYVKQKIHFDEKSLPDGAKPFSYWAGLKNPPSDFIDVVNYVYGRGRFIFSAMDYYWTPLRENRMNRRVIIPYMYDDKIVGYNSRYIEENKKALRYIKDSQSNYIFNYHVLNDIRRKYVIVVEGEFDAIAIDGVSMLGRNMSPEQAEWLKLSNKQIIIVADREESKNDASLAQYAVQYGFSASFPAWETNIKDVAKAVQIYGRLYTLKTILDSTIDDKFQINMHIKMHMKDRIIT